MNSQCSKWLTTLLMVSASSLTAQPQNPQVIAGSADISLVDQTTQITASDRSIVQWKSFSIAPDEVIRINLPSQKAANLNRVIGKDISQILGKLESNGQVYLVNPNGILIGKEGVIKTAGFFASTLDIADDQFLNGGQWTLEGEGGDIVNLGTIETTAGDLILIGKRIQNEGSLSSRLTFKETPEFSIAVSSCNIESLKNNPYAAAVAHDVSSVKLIENNGSVIIVSDSVINTGAIDVSGKVMIDSSKMINGGKITAHKGEVDVGSILVHLSGPYIETASGHLQAEGGVIKIQAPTIFSSGIHTVDNPQGTAGTISLLAKNVALPAAQLSANGIQSGTIFLGQEGGEAVQINPFTTLNTPDAFDLSIGLESGPTITQAQLIDPNQGGGTGFGTVIVTLSSGNVVVTKPGDNLFGADSGALYVYNASTTALISTLTGTQAGDQVSGGGVTSLTNGNFVVSSPSWANGAATLAGASTWINATTGFTGTVTPLNSLVGTQTGDRVSFSVSALTNGNYVVSSYFWANGAATLAGASTWCDGTTGRVGTVTTANSLVGTQANDRISFGGVVPLVNGNYVVLSYRWTSTLGAATWGSGTTGVVGAVSAANSLVGTDPFSQVSFGGVLALANGNYVVSSYFWANGATLNVGASTWGNGTTGVVGAVSAANSLVGTQANDAVSSGNTIALTNGNYVVGSPGWHNGAVANAGAATWVDGTTGIVGTITAANSLVGTQAGDQVSSIIPGNIALTNGNYVVNSPTWNNGLISAAGAATWGNGTTGIVGPVTTLNSLVGTQGSDRVSYQGSVALTNGNYVVCSPTWNNGVTGFAGAATWGNGATGTVGTVTTLNSLVGTQAFDQVSSNGAIALTNGNYVVSSPLWANGANAAAGAATWGDGTTGIAGPVSAANSLVGTQAGDQISSIIFLGIVPLANGNYVVQSPLWANGASAQAGAATWGDGTTGIVGPVSDVNSLVGTQAGDQVSSNLVYALANGNYVVSSPFWSDGATAQVGAATWGNGSTGVVGPVSSVNSLIGTQASDQVSSDRIRDFGLLYVVVSSSWDNGGLTDAGAVSIGYTDSGLTGTVSPLNSLVGQNSNSGLSFPLVQFSSPKSIVVAGFPTESSSGRVYLTFYPTPPPPPPVPPSVGKISTGHGVYNFSRAISNVFWSWDILTYGSILNRYPCTELRLYQGWEHLENCSKYPIILTPTQQGPR